MKEWIRGYGSAFQQHDQMAEVSLNTPHLDHHGYRHTNTHSRKVDIATSINVADYCWRQYQPSYMTHSYSEELPMVLQSIWVNGVTDCFSLSSLTISRSVDLFTLVVCSHTHTCSRTQPCKLIKSFKSSSSL